MVGTDIAELLLRDHRTVWLPGKSPNEANLIDFTNEAVEQVEEEESGEAQLSFLTDSQTATTSVLEKEIERFRELLLYGRKKVGSPADVSSSVCLLAQGKDQPPLGGNCSKCCLGMISGPLPDISEGISSVFSEKGPCGNLASSVYSHLERMCAHLCAESWDEVFLKTEVSGQSCVFLLIQVLYNSG